jgi:hypothetical protein
LHRHAIARFDASQIRRQHEWQDDREFRSGGRFGVGREAAKSQKSQANIAAAHQAGSLSRNTLHEISSRLPFDGFERLKPSGPQPIRAVLRIGLRIVVPFARAPRASLDRYSDRSEDFVLIVRC